MAEKIEVKGYIVLGDRLYTKSDEWVKVEDEDIAYIGITDYAQKKLRDIVGVELPEVGKEVKKGDVVATLESVKAAAEVYTPVSGSIVEVNERLYEEPEIINKDPYGEGWLCKIKLVDRSELQDLLKPEDYAKKIEAEEE